MPHLLRVLCALWLVCHQNMLICRRCECCDCCERDKCTSSLIFMRCEYCECCERGKMNILRCCTCCMCCERCDCCATNIIWIYAYFQALWMLCEGKMSILAHFHALWMLRDGRTVLLKCSIFYAWCCAMRWKLNPYIGAVCAIHSNTSNFIDDISNICVAAPPTCLSHSRVQIFRDSREGHSLYWWGRGVTQGDIHTHTHISLLLCPRFFFLHLKKNYILEHYHVRTYSTDSSQVQVDTFFCYHGSITLT